MRITDDRYHRDVRRYQLARRLIHHEARTQTICEWTGLTDERVRNLHRSYAVGEASALRHRGPPPRQFERVLRSPALRSEAAAALGICRALGIAADARQPSALPSLPTGERLCSAFELYRACIPDTALTLEQLMLLLTVLARGEPLMLAHCAQCHAAILSDCRELTRRVCAHCRETAISIRDSEPQQKLV